MNDEASASVDTGSHANDITSLFQSLSIGGDAHDGDVSMMTSEASEFVDVANDLTTTPQSLDVADDSLERDLDVLEPKHKIFLSHSGAQKSFVADLDDALKRRARYPFFDRSRSSLPVGEKFPSLIFDAIGQCEVGVVVLSEEFFTRTKWPMLELVAMVEESKKPNRRIKIIPVFYSISRNKCRDPTVQAKWMKDCWEKWERQDKRRIDLAKWKSALGIFGSTTGLEMKDGMLDGELRGEIVEAICKHVLPEMRWDDSKVEGKTRLCQAIYQMMYRGLQPKDWKGGVQIMGLYGMGGIGKTTACKILCNDLCGDYSDRVCHVEIGSLSELGLLKKVLGALSDLDDQIMATISDDGVGHRYLKSRIVKERVFLALDNVSDDTKEQAKSFLEANFGDGSVVLVTARSMDQLQCLGVKREDSFAMPELELEEAKSLFLSHARVEKNEVDRVLLEVCVKRCCFQKGQSSTYSSDDKHYHPLALKVLGSGVGDLIRQHDVARQAELITRISSFNLSRQKEHPVFSILRSSFDSLLEEDQLLFLHAALFLPENDYHSNLSSMIWLGMVDGRKGNDFKWRLECLRRRSLLESFGEYNWDFRMHDLWREFAAAEIEGGKWKDRCFLYETAECNGKVDLTRFQTMRVVKLMDVTNGVALDVRGLKQLRSLDVSGYVWGDSVVEVNGLGTLEDLTFLGCMGVASSACIAELGWLTNLQVVELVGFKGDKLPDMGKLTNLRILDLDLSRFLQRIELQNLTNLTVLFVWGCESLQSVDISGCRSITSISFLFRLSSTLEEVNVSSCPLLRELDGIWMLTKLRKLDITGCSSIEEFDELRELVELEELRALQCDSLTRLPSCRLPKLRVLDIEPKKVPAGFQWELGVKIRRFKERNANHRV